MSTQIAWGSSFGVSWGNSWGYAANSARSGYWRLFFYQMQEEALKKDGEGKKKAENTTTLRDTVDLVSVENKVSPSKDKRESRREKGAEPTIIPFKTRPIHSLTTIYDALFKIPALPELGAVKIQTQQLIEKVIQLHEECSRRRKRRRDEEMLLLLAA